MSIVGFNWKWEEVEGDIDNIFHHWKQNEDIITPKQNEKQEEIKLISHWKQDNEDGYEPTIKHFKDY